MENSKKSNGNSSIDNVNYIEGLSFVVRTYGCQQNVNDSEKIIGLLSSNGASNIEDENNADIIIFNTCAVRENAEDKVFGHVGNLKKLKEKNGKLIIALGGCMVQQQHIAERISKSYPYVDVIFNTNALTELPKLINNRLAGSKRQFKGDVESFEIIENIPTVRDSVCRAFVPIMYGCDNFCTYCVVPFVRGRERSRKSEDILAEVKSLVESGYKEIMLLGQNVNSYGKTLETPMDFSDLLKFIDQIDGDFLVRFMTSHPKDASKKLFETIQNSKHISHHIHLPVQSGSDAILERMNRRYSSKDYINLINLAKEIITDVSFSSDIIAGFPGESEEDFNQTLQLVEQVRYHSLFTFIYSKRKGTKAFDYQDETPYSEKSKRLTKLIRLQEETSAQLEQQLVGQTKRCLITEQREEGVFEARLDNNMVVIATGDFEINTFCDIHIEKISNNKLHGAKQISLN